MARVLPLDSQPLFMMLEMTRRLIADERLGGSPLAWHSPRERQVLALLICGWDSARIGGDLFISQHTVRTCIQKHPRNWVCA